MQGSNSTLPIVVSKMADWGGEFIHNAHYLDWLKPALGDQITVSFYTDRFE